MIETLRKLLQYESIAEHGEAPYPYGRPVAQAKDYMLDLCKSFGFRTKDADGKYAYAEIGEGEELIGILCHLDVVPEGDGWDYPAFDGTIAQVDGEERLYGRGTIDDKGPAVANVFAMKDILDSGRPLNKRIRIIFGQSEENGDWDDIKAYKAQEELPAYGYTPDGEFPAIYGENGITLFKVSYPLADSGFASIKGGSAPNAVPDYCQGETVDGKKFEAFGKAAHGCAPWLGENAISKAMEGLDEPFAVMYNELIGWDLSGAKLGIACVDAASGALTLNAGKVFVEEDNLILYLDIRYPVTAKISDLTDAITMQFAEYGATAELIHHMAPVYMDQHGPVMQALLSAYRQVTGDDTEAMTTGGGTYARAMENIIAFGPVFPGHLCTEHEKNEYILVEDFLKLRQVYRAALEALLELK